MLKWRPTFCERWGSPPSKHAWCYSWGTAHRRKIIRSVQGWIVEPAAVKAAKSTLAR
ncbi:Uncharacterised protein [Vibrio cholerae]|nr:Uncharacterised protein [Vibrio cholerae]